MIRVLNPPAQAAEPLEEIQPAAPRPCPCKLVLIAAAVAMFVWKVRKR